MTRRALPTTLIAFVLLVAPWSRPVSAATYHVNSTDDLPDADPTDGVCAAAGGACTLRAAVMQANVFPPSFDSIVLPAGTYTLATPNDPAHDQETGDLNVEDAVEIVGAGRDLTIIDGNYVWRIIRGGLSVASDYTLVMKRMTLRRGGAPNLAGGGIFSDGNTYLEDVEIRECRGDTGGGLYSGGTIIRTVITENVGGSCCGGVRTGDRFTMIDSTVSNNRTISGPAGGIHTYGGTDVLIMGSTISGNVATGQRGGGLLHGGDYALIVNSTFSGNSAGTDGGGIYRNAGYDNGGGSTPVGRVDLRNCTVTGNIADADGSGSGNGGGFFSATEGMYMRNTIVAGNTDTGGESPDCDADVWSDSHNIVGSGLGCSFIGNLWGDMVGVDARLAPLGDNGGFTETHALLPDSPAREAGHPMVPGSGGDTCSPTDQRGVPRPQPSRCDVGAYEDGTDFCASPRPGCVQAASRGSALKLRRSASGAERMSWKWKGAGAMDFGNPLELTGYALCVFDAQAAAPTKALEALVPAGTCATKPCWKGANGSFGYRSHPGLPSGVQALQMKARPTGTSTISMKGGGDSLGLPPMPLAHDQTIVVQLGRLDGGGCWEARFGTAARNDGSMFSARSD